MAIREIATSAGGLADELPTGYGPRATAHVAALRGQMLALGAALERTAMPPEDPALLDVHGALGRSLDGYATAVAPLANDDGPPWAERVLSLDAYWPTGRTALDTANDLRAALRCATATRYPLPPLRLLSTAQSCAIGGECPPEPTPMTSAPAPAATTATSWQSSGGWGDLDCDDVGEETDVYGGDPDGLDADGDGIGCEGWYDGDQLCEDGTSTTAA